MIGTQIEQNDLKSASDTLEEIAKIFALEVDIHKHTRQIGQHFHNCFNRIDQKYRLSNFRDFDTVYNEILGYANNDIAVKRVLDSIKRSAGAIEAETRINVRDLLVRTWDLANTSRIYSNIKDVIIENLKHNIQTQGGCLAGISARLVQPYSYLIHAIISNQYINEFNAGIMVSNEIDNDYDDDFELAIAMSKSLSFADAPTYSPFSQNDELENDEDMQLAIAMSLGTPSAL